MNDTPDEVIWQRLSKALFGGRKTTDEGLFTFRVMEQIRALQPAFQEIAWHRFLRWAVPMLGAGAASLILAARIPVSTITPAVDTAVFQPQTTDADPLSPVLDNF